MENIGIPEANRKSRPKRAGFWLRLLLTTFMAVHVIAHAEEGRKLKSGPPPEYPELAKRLNIQGAARVEVTIAPDGSVKQVKELGGNPVLVEALARAVKKWKYEPAAKTSVLEVKYTFGQPQ